MTEKSKVKEFHKELFDDCGYMPIPWEELKHTIDSEIEKNKINEPYLEIEYDTGYYDSVKINIYLKGYINEV